MFEQFISELNKLNYEYEIVPLDYLYTLLTKRGIKKGKEVSIYFMDNEYNDYMDLFYLLTPKKSYYLRSNFTIIKDSHNFLGGDHVYTIEILVFSSIKTANFGYFKKAILLVKRNRFNQIIDYCFFNESLIERKDLIIELLIKYKIKPITKVKEMKQLIRKYFCSNRVSLSFVKEYLKDKTWIFPKDYKGLPINSFHPIEKEAIHNLSNFCEIIEKLLHKKGNKLLIEQYNLKLIVENKTVDTAFIKYISNIDDVHNFHFTFIIYNKETIKNIFYISASYADFSAFIYDNYEGHSQKAKAFPKYKVTVIGLERYELTLDLKKNRK
ncbi:MAG: hypothetical protein LBM99_05245 [Bacillales bacterium]|jgi:hypothetical protein|nr:hypothetical protein [Bacillales bacterium]